MSLERFPVTRIWRQIVSAALWLLLAKSASALDPSIPPGGNFDLANWKLQLPTAGGVLTGTAGSVDEISAAQLVAGFTNAYFFTGADGAMNFWAPDNGATTGGSSHPRSELREMLDPSTSSLNWTLYGLHVMTAQCKVLRVPSDTQKVCIGQIHESNYLIDGITPSAGNEQMIMFDFGNKKIYANINLDGNQSSSFSQTLISGAAVQTNAAINYMMSVSNGLLTISVNNVTNAWNLFSGTNYQGHTATNWDLASSNVVYFKAGSYNQTANTCGCSNDGAQVAFYKLTRWHSAAITNQPFSVVSGAGSNVNFAVGAVGNSGTLSYQWQLNGTNVSASATSAALSVTNLTASNVGNYTVIVTDPTPGFNSITSAVATLTGSFPPVITSQPADQIIPVGSNVTFNVSATGLQPITYRWWYNRTNSLGSATNTTLVITNAQLTNSGIYLAIVSNSLGVVTSSVATLTVGSPGVSSTNVWLDDFWLDGTRTDTALPAESAWFANNGSSLAAVPGALIGSPDPSVTLTWWTYFTSNAAAPVRLAVGDQLRITLRFTIGGIASSNNNRGLRLGLFNSSGGTRTLLDGANPSGIGHTGYMLNMNFGSVAGLSSPLQFLERTNISSANLISTVNDYTVLGQGGPAVGSAGFSNGLPYTLVFTALRNAGSVSLTTAFSSTNGWSESYSAIDNSATNADFDMFVFRPAAQPQTATNFTFTEIKVELVATNNHTPVPGFHLAATTQDIPLVLAVANLLANDYDPDGDPIAITAVSGTSTNGGPVSLAGGSITYVPAKGFSGADRFSYTLTDLRGASALGNVYVTVAPPLRFGTIVLSNQVLQLNFTGTPGSNYVLQTSTNLSAGLWQDAATNATDLNGLGVFIETNNLAVPQKFFRIMTP
jgi:hypothetical protein